MKREWTVYLEDDYDAANIDASVRDLTTCLMRLGGVGAISPVRQGVRGEDGKVEYINVGVHFKYDSYAPGINPDPEAREEDVPVMVPVGDEAAVEGALEEGRALAAVEDD